MGAARGVLPLDTDRAGGRVLDSEISASRGEHLGHPLACAIGQRTTVGERLRMLFYRPLIEGALEAAPSQLHAKVDARNPGAIAEVGLAACSLSRCRAAPRIIEDLHIAAAVPPLLFKGNNVLTQLDPTSHWLAGQMAGIHLFTLAGGMAIGAAAVLLYRTIGRIAGISGILFTGMREGGLWRWLFLVGIVLGAGLGAYLLPSLNIVSRPHPGLWILILSGLLVGWGTRQGSGCTSGHGVCGLGRLSLRSLVAVLVFMAAGIFTASLLRHWLGVPA